MEEEQHAGAGPETTGNQAEHRERDQYEHPRIYVASLSDYNAGVLHGGWIDAAEDAETVHQQITTMLALSATTSRAEEYAIHDYEGFGNHRVSEYEPISAVTKIARGIREHGPAFAAWASRCDGEEHFDHFEGAYLGSHDSLTDYAAQLLEDIGLERIIEEHVPDSLQPYVHVDSEGFGNDLVLGGDISVVEHDNGVWVFEGNAWCSRSNVYANRPIALQQRVVE